MATWHNADGLFIKFGTSEGKSVSGAGEYLTYGPTRVVELDIDLTDLTETEAVQNDTVVLPVGAQIEKVEIMSHETAATGVAVDIGLVNVDRSTGLTYGATAADPDALVVTQATADLAVGESVVYGVGVEVPTQGGSGAAGAAIGAILTGKCLVTASRTTSTAFTAGRISVRIHLRPNANA